MIDLLRFFAGDVASLFAYGFSHGDAQAVSATIQFVNNSVGQLNMNSGHSWSDCFEQTYISGSGAGILIDASKTTEIMSQDRRFADGEEKSIWLEQQILRLWKHGRLDIRRTLYQRLLRRTRTLRKGCAWEN